jgi:pimeloyl-ACP methyl ester carboxylesterase
MKEFGSSNPSRNDISAPDVPMLHLGGDHDISVPVENWYALSEQLPTMSLITYPRAGHAAHAASRHRNSPQ